MLLRCALLLLVVVEGRYESVPHVRHGVEYDDSWYVRPLEVASLGDLVYENVFQRTLVAFVDESKPCASGFDGTILRNGQRFVVSRYLKVAVAKNREEWPLAVTSDCALAVVNNDHTVAKLVPIEKFTLGRVRDLVQETSKATFRVTNGLEEIAKIFWYDQKFEESASDDAFRLVFTLNPKESTEIVSFVGHVFAAEDSSGNVIAKFTCRGDGDEAKILREATSLPLNPHDHNALAMYDMFLKKSKSDSDTMRFAAREDVFDLAFEKRLALNDVQNRLVPNVTIDGFKLQKMPQDLYDQVKSWFDQKRSSTLTLPESDGGPLYNQRYVPTYHTPLPPDIKSRVFDGLKTVMEQWAPTTAPLTGTSLYGVRTYDRDSYLHLHADTAATHVVSGIVNIDQQSDTPWPVQIFDHHGTLHTVTMEPGDLLLYESAKLLHGRVEPFNGSFYANIFVHYAPTNWHVPL